MAERRRRVGGIEPRRLAVEILDRVERTGAFAAPLVDRAQRRLGDLRDAALVQRLVLGVLQRRTVLDRALGRVLNRPLRTLDPRLLPVLRSAAYAILFLERVPPYATVDIAVELVRRRGPAKAAGLVNAALRRLVREREALKMEPPREGDVEALAVWASHPAWWVRRLVMRVGWSRAVAILEAQNEPPDLTLHGNRRWGSAEQFQRFLARTGAAWTPSPVLDDSVRVASPLGTVLPLLREGAAWVQDDASQLAASLASGSAGPRALDACAAPGGKTLHLAERLAGEGWVAAADKSPARLRRLLDNATRCRLRDRVAPVAADLLENPFLTDRFDTVVLDAPCSGTGTLRRHPEIRWRLRPESLAAHGARQRAMLEAAAACVREGGVLVYSVCSMEPEEGEDVVREFLTSHREFRVDDPAPVLPPPARPWVSGDGFLRTWPDRFGLDGFFAARLRKKERL